MDRLLKFRYKNWRGDDHEYVIKIDKDAPMKYSNGGNGVNSGWQISGDCIERDGALREGTPRRSFRLLDMRDVEEVYERAFNDDRKTY